MEGYSRPVLFALLLVFALSWFGTLEYRKLIKPDEGRYAEIAREMAITGDWVTPRLNGIKYFEKPPLQYWMTAATFNAFGLNEWTARLWSGLTGFAGVLLAAFAGRRLFGATAGVLAGMALGTSLWYLIIGHLNTLDMGVTFFLEAALCAFLFAQGSPRASPQERRWMLAAWAAMALAVLSKGLAGLVLPAFVLLAYCAIERSAESLKRMHFALGVPLFLAIAAPWFIAVSIANPEFPRFFFLHEHFERFLTRAHGRYQPWWYFVPILMVGLLPWTTFAIQAAVSAWRQPAQNGFNARRFLVVWAVAILVFFSASSSKLPSYILPVFPALALLTGDWLARCRAPALRWHIVVVGLISMAAVVTLHHLTGYADAETPEVMIDRYARWLIVASAVFAVGTLFALWQNLVGRKLVALALVALAALFTGETTLQGHEALGRSNSADYISKQLMPHLAPGVPFYSVGMYEQTLPFYIRRTVTLVDYRDEFAFGLEQEPHRSIPTMAQFRQRWASDARALAMFTKDGYRQAKAEGLPMNVIAEDTRRVVVAKP
jgi:4-amino-4-deoxy-L-arabinose transferase-like glycosyltransferase